MTGKSGKYVAVLVTSVGSTTALSVIKSLRLSSRYQFRIIGTDINKPKEIASSYFCDQMYQVPLYKQKDYLDRLLKICLSEKVRVLVPVLDQEVEKLAKYSSLFSRKGISVAASAYESVKICNDKYLTYLYLKKSGIKTPPVYEIKSALEENLQPPLFLKPRNGVSSVGCYRITSLSELTILANKVNNPVVQKELSGEKFVIDVINDMDGRNLASVPRLEISSKAGIGVKARVVKDSQLSKYGAKVSEVIKIRGAANIEVFKKNNSIKLIEINPRFSAGSILTCVAGCNMAEIVVDLNLGNRISLDRFRYRKNVFMARFWQEIFYSGNKVIYYHD